MFISAWQALYGMWVSQVGRKNEMFSTTGLVKLTLWIRPIEMHSRTFGSPLRVGELRLTDQLGGCIHLDYKHSPVLVKLPSACSPHLILRPAVKQVVVWSLQRKKVTGYILDPCIIQTVLKQDIEPQNWSRASLECMQVHYIWFVIGYSTIRVWSMMWVQRGDAHS